MSAYWRSKWPGEDGGPRRYEVPLSGSGLNIVAGEPFTVTSREAMASTMVVLREPGEVYLLRHTLGIDTVSWVEQIDPVTLEPIRRSPDLAGGPMWPGGLAAHANGSLYVVFGRYAHRLSSDLTVLASCELPRDRPYNSFVITPEGHIATKDFAGTRPLADPTADDPDNSELLILEPNNLTIIARLELPERSIARTMRSASGRRLAWTSCMCESASSVSKPVMPKGA